MEADKCPSSPPPIAPNFFLIFVKITDADGDKYMIPDLTFYVRKGYSDLQDHELDLILENLRLKCNGPLPPELQALYECYRNLQEKSTRVLACGNKLYNIHIYSYAPPITEVLTRRSDFCMRGMPTRCYFIGEANNTYPPFHQPPPSKNAAGHYGELYTDDVEKEVQELDNYIAINASSCCQNDRQFGLVYPAEFQQPQARLNPWVQNPPLKNQPQSYNPYRMPQQFKESCSPLRISRSSSPAPGYNSQIVPYQRPQQEWSHNNPYTDVASGDNQNKFRREPDNTFEISRRCLKSPLPQEWSIDSACPELANLFNGNLPNNQQQNCYQAPPHQQQQIAQQQYTSGRNTPQQNYSQQNRTVPNIMEPNCVITTQQQLYECQQKMAAQNLAAQNMAARNPMSPTFGMSNCNPPNAGTGHPSSLSCSPVHFQPIECRPHMPPNNTMPNYPQMTPNCYSPNCVVPNCSASSYIYANNPSQQCAGPVRNISHTMSSPMTSLTNAGQEALKGFYNGLPMRSSNMQQAYTCDSRQATSPRERRNPWAFEI